MQISKLNYLLLVSLSCILINAERKLSENNCQCGVTLLKDNMTINPWLVYVHFNATSTQTRTCVGTLLSSNVILTSRKCLLGGASLSPNSTQQNPSPPQRPNITHVVVSSDKEPKGGATASYPVVDIRPSGNCSKTVAIQVDFDFTSKGSNHTPICIPTREELPRLGASFLGSNVSYISGAGGGMISNLVVKKGRDCDPDGSLQLGSAGIEEDVMCVSIPDADTSNNAEPDVVGQPLYLELGINPYHSYPFGFYTYLAGISTFVRVGGDGRKQVFFLPVTAILETVESMATTPSTRWCSQPWSWLNAPEKIKRDESLDCECGIRKDGPKGRIAGGEDAIPYEFPWMAGLEIVILHGGEYVGMGFRGCGGAIINDRVILTAAHCITSFQLIEDLSTGYNVQGPKQKYKVFLHSQKRDNDTREVTIEIKLDKTLIHPGFIDGWRKPAFEQDIALLILDNPLNFSAIDPEGGEPLYSPICLPKWGKRIDVFGKEALAAGWGYLTMERDKLPEVLQKNKLTLQSTETCLKLLNSTSRAKRNAVICAVDANQYLVQGDSGGPIIVDDGNGKYTQVGIASYVGQKRLGDVDLRATYLSDVQELLSWVDYHSDLIKAKYCKK